MSAKTKTLIEISIVEDHDCGNYRIGEAEVLSKDMTEFFERYGYRGFSELSMALVFASNRILDAYREYNSKKFDYPNEARSPTPKKDVR